MKTRAAFFPFTDETFPIAHHLLATDSIYEIVAVLTYPGSGLAGKDIGVAMNRDKYGISVNSISDIDSAEWDVLLVANVTTSRTTRLFILESIKLELLRKKTVICATIFDAGELAEIYGVADANNNFIYLNPTRDDSILGTWKAENAFRLINSTSTSLNKKPLFTPSVPVIFVGGVIDEADTFEVFINLTDELRRRSITVCALSANPNCTLGEFDSFFSIYRNTKLAESEKVLAINNYIEELYYSYLPDIIVIHLSGAMLEYNEKIPNDFGIMPFLISKTIKPDYFICAFPYELVVDEFISQTNRIIEGRYDFGIDCAHRSNIVLDGLHALTNFEVSIIHANQEFLSRLTRNQYGGDTQCATSTFNLTDIEEVSRLCDSIVEQIKSGTVVEHIL